MKPLIIALTVILYPLFIVWCVIRLVIEAWADAKYMRTLKGFEG